MRGHFRKEEGMFVEKKKPAERAKEQLETYEGEPSRNPFVEERYEIVEGVRYDFLTAPVVSHQRILAAMFRAMDRICSNDGILLFAPIDVYLDENNRFQPDLVYIAHDNASILTEQRIEGAPDLVAEILSPSTSSNDKIRKKRQYERHGVQEYWIADPTHRTVDQFVSRGGKFELHETYGLGDTLTSPLFGCVEIDMNELFANAAPAD